MAKKKDASAIVAQWEFNLRAVEHLRRGLILDGADASDNLVVRADAIIADYGEKIRKAKA